MSGLLQAVSFTAAREWDEGSCRSAVNTLVQVPFARQYFTGGARGGDKFIGRWLYAHRPDAEHLVIVPARRSQVDPWWEPGRVVDHRKNAYDVLIDRSSIWGNPFLIGRDGGRDEVIAKYRAWLLKNPALMTRLPELAGLTLGCWCKPEPCHGDVLAELATPVVTVIKMQPGTDYQARNARLVAEATAVFGLPAYPEEDPRSERSGTWQTIRIARRADKLSMWACTQPPYAGQVERWPSQFPAVA